MSDPSTQGSPENSETPDVVEPAGWTRNWQMPTLLLGVSLLVVGLWMLVPTPEEIDLPDRLRKAEKLVIAGELDKAEDVLAGIDPYMEESAETIRATRHVIEGDLAFERHHRRPGGDPVALEATLASYDAAETLGHELDDVRRSRVVFVLTRLSRYDEALTALAAVSAEGGGQAVLLRRIIEGRRGQGAEIDDLLKLLARFTDVAQADADAVRRRGNLIWAAALRGRLLLNSGDPMRAVDHLTFRYARFADEGGDADLGPLAVVMGQAAQMMGKPEEADQWYRSAQKKLPADHPDHAEAILGLAQLVLEQTGDVQEALASYQDIESRFADHEVYFDALVGRGDCEARLGADAQALEQLGRAVAYLKDRPHLRQQRADRLAMVVQAHFERHRSGGRHELARQYLELLPALFDQAMSRQVLADFAMVHEALGLERQTEADRLEASLNRDAASAPRQRLAAREAVDHFVKAAEFHHQLARTASVTDDELHGNSLWESARLFGMARHWKRAIDVYGEFIHTRPGDQRSQEATHRLAMASMADGQYRPAAELMEELIELHPRGNPALQSLVPLARCKLILGETDEARRILEHILTSNPAITPEAAPYREALVELGRLHYEQREFARAITRIEEAVERYGESEQGPALRFRLADAYRQSAEAIEKQMDPTLPPSRRQALTEERVRRLDQALILFSQAISGYEARPADSLTALDATFYRNAWFYRGDCAYALRRFEQSIELYNLAAKRWEHHPASLLALVQMVNAYCEQGRTVEARAANERARRQLQRIPDEAFDDPTLPLNRGHWEAWLRWSSELNLFASSASKPVASVD